MMLDFRPQYRKLNRTETDLVERIKDTAEQFDAHLGMTHALQLGNAERDRHIAIARTHLETAVMFAVKAVTG